MVVVAALVSPMLTLAERRPLTKPEYSTDLGDTSRDIEVRDVETTQYVFRDSGATASFDVSKGRYDFRFKDEEDIWVDAHWIPCSNIDVTVAADVLSLGDGRLQYRYMAVLRPTSVRNLKRVTVETYSDLDDPDNLGEPGSPGTTRRLEAGEWHGRELSRDWGKRLWTWTRYTGNLPADALRASGTLRLESLGLPSPMPCWVGGDGSSLFCDQEPVVSIDRLCSMRSSILTDSAHGTTIGPGLETVELPALRKYFDTSVEQGWLEDGPYREELRALLEDAVGRHESGETEGVLEALKRFSDKVDAVYAQENSPMLSEAYALFHFNTAYLMEHYGKETAASPGEEQEQPASTAIPNQP